MKIGMKKLTACLLAILMVLGAVSAYADTIFTSPVIAGNAEGYREALDILAPDGKFVLVGQTLQLGVNEDYAPVWSSSDEKVATVDANGLVTALAGGETNIKATAEKQTATILITVIDPEPLMEEIQEQEVQPEPEPEAQPETKPTEEPETPAEVEQKPAAPQKISMVIVVNGAESRYVYDGQEHVLDQFVATANRDSFDASKIKVTGEIGISATDCGIYEMKLDKSAFRYDDANVNATFVVNNGWMRITPAHITVTANAITKQEGEPDPELTATVTGLVEGDEIKYEIYRMPGEKVGEYVIDIDGKEKQGNYKIDYVPGKFVIEGQPTVTVESSIPAGSKVYAGTEITLKAIPAGFGDATLTYQWQWSTDGENWTDIEGATKKTYTYIIDRQNAKYKFRVCVNTVD